MKLEYLVNRVYLPNGKTLLRYITEEIERLGGEVQVLPPPDVRIRGHQAKPLRLQISLNGKEKVFDNILLRYHFMQGTAWTSNRLLVQRIIDFLNETK